MTDANGFFNMTAAPMRIGTVALKVRDLETVSAFYQSILGLAPLTKEGNRIVLGTSTAPLIELVGDPSIMKRDPRQAGLFHTAFLLPSRADLARWLGHAAESRVSLQGASDHLVSEAIYLADPEGNGIEVYADRPVSEWRRQNGEIRMATDPLNTQELLEAADATTWSGFPESGVIGHVHLQVGDTVTADRIYRDVLGFDISVRYPGASFYGSGGYHHQLAGNAWNSRGAGRRTDAMAGLESVEVIVRDIAEREAILARAQSSVIEITSEDSGANFRDPWGTAIKLRT